MGLFGNTKTKNFKNKMADVFNLIANYSYGEVPRSSIQTIDSQCNELSELYRQFSNPFEETFNSFTTFTSVFGDKTSIAEGMYIICLARILAFKGYKMSTGTHQQIILESKRLYSSVEGRQEMIQIINSL